MFIKTSAFATAIATAINNIPSTEAVAANGHPVWSTEIDRDLRSKTRTVSEVRLMPDRAYRVCVTDYEINSDRVLFVSKSKPKDFFENIEDAIARAIECSQEIRAAEGLDTHTVHEQLESTLLMHSIASSGVCH